MIRALVPSIRRLSPPSSCLSASSSFSTIIGAPPKDDAEHPPSSSTVIQGPSLLTSTGVHRPSPSLFQLPGLRSLPFWTAPGSSTPEEQHQRRHRIAFNDPLLTSAVQHVESNYDAIREEYFSAVLGLGNASPQNERVSNPLEPDYDVSSKGGEHAEDALHSGKIFQMIIF